jgi:hypothetical protein
MNAPKINEMEIPSREYGTPKETEYVYLADWNEDAAKRIMVGSEEIQKRLNPKAFGLKYDPWHIVNEATAKQIWAEQG